MSRLGRLVAASALALLSGCSALSGQAPTAQPSFPARTTAPTGTCSVFVENDDIGSGQTFGGRDFPAEVPLELRFGGPDTEPITEVDFSELVTDVRGVFELHLYANRENIGPQQIWVTGGGCSATTSFNVSAERFPEAACDPVDEAPPSGGRVIDDYIAAVAAEEPIAWWRFEGPEGLELEQSATLGQPGFLEGSRSVLLSGHGDLVSVPEVKLATDFTIEAWVRLCGEDITRFDALLGQAGEAPEIGFAGWRAQLWIGDRNVLESSEPVDRDGWMHVVVTRAGDRLVMYQQGEAVASGDWDGVFTVTALGAGEAFGGGTMEGWLDEVALYDHALLGADIAAHAAFSP